MTVDSPWRVYLERGIGREVKAEVMAEKKAETERCA
jgi:hypothetical protein